MIEQLSDDVIERLAQQGVQRTFRAGEVLMRLGDWSPSLHIIAEGRVRVVRSGRGIPHTVAELGPGDVVGEIGVLSRSARTATVTAIENTRTLELSADAVESLVEELPSVRDALLHAFAKRLRESAGD